MVWYNYWLVKTFFSYNFSDCTNNFKSWHDMIIDYWKTFSFLIIFQTGQIISNVYLIDNWLLKNVFFSYNFSDCTNSFKSWHDMIIYYWKTFFFLIIFETAQIISNLGMIWLLIREKRFFSYNFSDCKNNFKSWHDMIIEIRSLGWDGKMNPIRSLELK